MDGALLEAHAEDRIRGYRRTGRLRPGIKTFAFQEAFLWESFIDGKDQLRSDGMIRREYTNPDYLARQYAQTDRLRARIEFHARHSEPANDWHRFLLETVDARAGDTLLDAGCGDGRDYHPALLEAGVRLFAIDRSPGMARQAASHGGCVAVGDVATLPFMDGFFDVVMCNHVLYHLPDQDAGLFELRRVCRSGGRVAVAANSRKTMAELWALVSEATARAGVDWRNPGDQGAPFAIEDEERVRAVFPAAQLHRRVSALVVRDPDAIVRYIATMRDDRSLLRALWHVAAEAIASSGAIRIQRIAGVFIAAV